MDFIIKTPVFEGPLELLLELIEKRKLHINDVSLAKVTDDFIEYVQRLQNYPMAHTAEFIVVASTLLLIKSKSLLPALSLTDEEAMTASDLERRLKLLARFKELSLHVKNSFGKLILFPRREEHTVTVIFSPHESMTMLNLSSAIRSVLAALPKVEVLPKAIVKKVLSLEEMINHLTKRIQASLKLSFRDFAGVGREEKVHIIVSFLAVLELVKQGIVYVAQESHRHDIHIEAGELGIPKYSSGV